MVFNKRNFHISKSYSQKRIGPHNINVVSAIIGNLLGDGHAEKRNDATRFHIHMNNKNAEYIFWLHSFFNKNIQAEYKYLHGNLAIIDLLFCLSNANAWFIQVGTVTQQ